MVRFNQCSWDLLSSLRSLPYPCIILSDKVLLCPNGGSFEKMVFGLLVHDPFRRCGGREFDAGNNLVL